MAEKKLVSEWLSEKKLLEKKINEEIERLNIVEVKKKNEAGVHSTFRSGDSVIDGGDGYISMEAYKEHAESSYQKIMDMIERFTKIEAAIIESNANNKISTSYGEYSVAFALSLLRRLSSNGKDNYLDELRKHMDENLWNCLQKIKENKKRLSCATESMRTIICSRDKEREEWQLEMVDRLETENSLELVDPIDVCGKFVRLGYMEETLRSEISEKIKVSGASTYIEI